MDGRIRLKVEGMEREYEALYSESSGGNILVALPTLPTDELMRWVFDPLSRRSGALILDDMHGESLGTTRFEKGRCTGFKVHCEPADRPPNVMFLLTIKE